MQRKVNVLVCLKMEVSWCSVYFAFAKFMVLFQNWQVHVSSLILIGNLLETTDKFKYHESLVVAAHGIEDGAT